MWDLSVHDLSIMDFIINGQEVLEVMAMGTNPYSAKDSLAFLLVRYNSLYRFNSVELGIAHKRAKNDHSGNEEDDCLRRYCTN